MTTVIRGSDNFDTGAGTRILISEATAANDATIEFTTGFSSTLYDYYTVEFERVIPDTDAQQFRLRLSNDGGSTFISAASSYGWGYLAITTTVGSTNNTADTQIVLASNAGSAANENGVSGYINIYNMHDTSGRTHVQNLVTNHNQDGNNFANYGRGNRLANEENNALQFFFASGNIESGTIRLYGVK